LNLRTHTDTGVDVVCLWGNGNADDWRSQPQVVSNCSSPQDQQDLALYGDVEDRYRNNHGHVYIVTDHPVPDGLAGCPIPI